MDKRSYYAVIPAEVRYNRDLSPNAKLLYGEITALADEQGNCYETNRYFAELYDVSQVSVSKWINQLVKNGYLNSTLIYKKDSKEVDQRVLNISLLPPTNNSLLPPKEKFNTPLKKSLRNNIYIYNTHTLDSIIDNNIDVNNNNSKPTKNKTQHFSPEVEKALEYFILLFGDLKTKPTNKGQKEKWLYALAFIEKHYNLKETYLAIKWARQDSFWQSNVLSLPPLLISKNGERKLDKILAKYRSLNSKEPEVMQRIKGEWKIVTNAEGVTELQVINQQGKTINEFLLTQHNGLSKNDITTIKNYLNGKSN